MRVWKSLYKSWYFKSRYWTLTLKTISVRGSRFLLLRYSSRSQRLILTRTFALRPSFLFTRNAARGKFPGVCGSIKRIHEPSKRLPAERRATISRRFLIIELRGRLFNFKITFWHIPNPKWFPLNFLPVLSKKLVLDFNTSTEAYRVSGTELQIILSISSSFLMNDFANELRRYKFLTEFLFITLSPLKLKALTA